MSAIDVRIRAHERADHRIEDPAIHVDEFGAVEHLVLREAFSRRVVDRRELSGGGRSGPVGSSSLTVRPEALHDHVAARTVRQVLGAAEMIVITVIGRIDARGFP
jgi:hypothetical protein